MGLFWFDRSSQYLASTQVYFDLTEVLNIWCVYHMSFLALQSFQIFGEYSQVAYDFM